jgi:hypothetical protein
MTRPTFVTPQSMQLMVTAFLRDGLVERRTDPDDQRVLRNHLTRDGERQAGAAPWDDDGWRTGPNDLGRDGGRRRREPGRGDAADVREDVLREQLLRLA